MTWPSDHENICLRGWWKECLARRYYPEWQVMWMSHHEYTKLLEGDWTQWAFRKGSCIISTCKWGWSVPTVTRPWKDADSWEVNIPMHRILFLSTLAASTGYFMENWLLWKKWQKYTNNSMLFVIVVALRCRLPRERILLNKYSLLPSWYNAVVECMWVPTVMTGWCEVLQGNGEAPQLVKTWHSYAAWLSAMEYGPLIILVLDPKA